MPQERGGEWVLPKDEIAAGLRRLTQGLSSAAISGEGGVEGGNMCELRYVDENGDTRRMADDHLVPPADD